MIGLLIVGLFWMVISWRDTIQWYFSWKAFSDPSILIPDMPFRLNGGNTIAAFYSILFFTSLILLLNTKSRILKIFFGVYLVSLCLLLFLSSSRGAWIGIVFGLISLFVLEKNSIKTIYYRYKNLKLIKYGVISAFGLGLIFFVFLYIQVLGKHPNHVPGLGVRAPFWVPAWSAFLKSPLIGTGPYTGGTYFILSTSIPWQHIYLHAHNTYLDVFRDTGLIGFISFCLFLFYLLSSIKKSYSNNKNDYFLLAAFCSLAAYLGHSIFDGTYLMPFASISMLLMIGVSLKFVHKSQIHYINIKRFSLIKGSFVIIGAIFFLWSNFTLNQGITSYNKNDLEKSYFYFQKVTDTDYMNTIAHVYKGIIASLLIQENPNLYTDIAIQSFEESIKLDSNWAVNHINLAALYQSIGDSQKAKDHFLIANRLANNWYVPSLNLGIIAEKENNLQSASDYYLKAIDNYPDISGSSFWTKNDFRTSIILKWLKKNQDDQINIKNIDLITHQVNALPMIKLSAQLIDTQPEKAFLLIKRSRLAETLYPYINAERDWVEAEIDFKNGNYKNALIIGQRAINFTKLDGIYGPGSAGTSLYYDGVYRAPVLPVEFVPQLTTIPLPGEWEHRYFTLAEWYAFNNDAEGCQKTLNQLLSYVPDYLSVYEKSSPCGGK